MQKSVCPEFCRFSVLIAGQGGNARGCRTQTSDYLRRMRAEVPVIFTCLFSHSTVQKQKLLHNHFLIRFLPFLSSQMSGSSNLTLCFEVSFPEFSINYGNLLNNLDMRLIYSFDFTTFLLNCDFFKFVNKLATSGYVSKKEREKITSGQNRFESNCCRDGDKSE